MNRADLVALLELVKPGLSDTNLVPVFTCFVFNQETVSAYNDTLGIVANCNLGDKPFAVNGTTFLGLLQNSHSEDIELTVAKENVVVTAGRSDFKLPYFGEKEFLFEEPQDPWDATIKLDKNFKKYLEFCRATTTSDSTLPALMGVCFNLKEKALYSCDGDSITKIVFGSEYVKGGGVFTVPNSFCDALFKVCDAVDSYEGTLSFNQGWVVGELKSGYTLYGRMIENSDPLDHATEIKNTLKEVPDYVDLPMGFAAALSRARVVADAESAKTIMTVKGGKLKLHTETHMGVIKDELSIRGHADVQAEVHASLVQRSIGMCDKIAILENCTSYMSGTHVLQVVSNIGE